MGNNENLSQGIKVANWITNGVPSKYGVQLRDNRFIPLKQTDWSFLHRLWHRLKQPQMFYYEEDNSIEFVAQGLTKT